MRISDWSSDVCSSDLTQVEIVGRKSAKARELLAHPCRIAHGPIDFETRHRHADRVRPRRTIGREDRESVARRPLANGDARLEDDTALVRSEEHTSELQSLMRISYAVFCLKKKKKRSHKRKE